jgi:hypothetical protein
LSGGIIALVFDKQTKRRDMPTTQTQTDCIQRTFGFQGIGKRKVEVDFSGGHLSSDGGGLLLGEVDKRLGLCRRLSECFTDCRDQRLIEHTLPTLIAQRVQAIALGYEDINDHDRLRLDPLLAVNCGRPDVLGEQRHSTEDKGKPLAGKSTLNRLELGAQSTHGHYRKIQANAEEIEDLLLETGVKAIPRKSEVIVLDFDATDDPIHGDQEGRFFHGYYKNYCYLPLYCFCGDIPLWAELRESNQDGSAGTKEALEKILKAIRKRFGKHVIVIVRADSGFCRNELLSWIEQQPKVHYCIGLARNSRLEKLLEPTFAEVLEDLGYNQLVECAQAAGADKLPEISQLEGSARGFADLRYKTLKSWDCERRVIGKAEVTNGKKNPRYIVTDLTGEEQWAQIAENKVVFENGKSLYEKFYCARGEMENKIKEQQLDMFADRTSTGYMKSNQLRLWFSTFAYMLVSRLRAVALRGTRLSNATVGNIRVQLMKIAAQVTVSVRRVYVRLASSCPAADVFAQAHRNLQSWNPQLE